MKSPSELKGQGRLFGRIQRCGCAFGECICWDPGMWWPVDTALFLRERIDRLMRTLERRERELEAQACELGAGSSDGSAADGAL